MLAETELKLAVSSRSLERLAAHVATRAGQEAKEDRLRGAYFDTVDMDLRRQGIALRVRSEARGWVQCVKRDGPIEAGVHRREESETVVPQHVPQPDRIDDPALAAAVAAAAGNGSLRAVFATDFRRRTWMLQPAPGDLVEVSLDRGRITSGGRRELISEIELELKAGPVWRLYDLAIELEREAPLRVEPLSKAERGYALATGMRAGPVRAKSAPLVPAMSALEAFRAACFACIAHLDANRAGLLAGTDRLHSPPTCPIARPRCGLLAGSDRLHSHCPNLKPGIALRLSGLQKRAS